jgi:hypothetical protein
VRFTPGLLVGSEQVIEPPGQQVDQQHQWHHGDPGYVQGEVVAMFVTPLIALAGLCQRP